MRKTNFKSIEMKKVLSIILALSLTGGLTGCGGVFGGAATAPASDIAPVAEAADVAVDNSVKGEDYAAPAAEEAAPDIEESFYSDAAPAAEVAGSDVSNGFAPEYRDDSLDYRTDEFTDVQDNEFTSVKDKPFSTFGADVDTASYTEVRSMILGQDITDNEYIKDAVRLEEFVNYFDYDYKDPERGQKFGVDKVLTYCPWNKDAKLLRVGIKAEEKGTDKPSNLVFLVDVSGSMNEQMKLPLLKRAMNILADNLKKEDKISIVTYSGEERVALDSANGNETDKIKSAINTLEAEGSTNGEAGLRKAYEIAERNFIKDGNNRIILCSDGDLNVGMVDNDDLETYVSKKKDNGVMLSVLGFGYGNYKDSKMETIADKGNGNYHYIDCLREAEKVLNKELTSTLYTVAKDVKFQLEFNPNMVKGYRQLGYENRAMAAEDFNNDKKDGGEVGSGQTVTVLYEIIPVDSDMDVPGDVKSRYGNNESKDTDKKDFGMFDPRNNEYCMVNIRYKEPDKDKSELIEVPITNKDIKDNMDYDTGWAALVAEMAMLMKGSENAGDTDAERVVSGMRELSRMSRGDEDKKECAEILNIWLKNNGYNLDYGDEYDDSDFDYKTVGDTECKEGSRNPSSSDKYSSPSDFDFMLDKPVIYLYGYDGENVTVNLKLDGTITVPYPATSKQTASSVEWSGNVKDGKINIGDNDYRYLFWEGKINNPEWSFEKGFCVAGSDTLSFLETKLKSFGFNSQEIEDFVTYWVPQMKDSPYNVISFQTSAYTSKAKLTVTPEPNKKIRLFMAWYPTDTAITLPAQNFNIPKREGKTVVEWGGTCVKSKKNDTEDSDMEIGDEVVTDDETTVAPIVTGSTETPKQPAVTTPVPSNDPYSQYGVMAQCAKDWDNTAAKKCGQTFAQLDAGLRQAAYTHYQKYQTAGW